LSTFININQQISRYTHMMNQEDIFKKIGQILNELNEQYQYLAQNPGELNELELELFLANSSFLSDHVQIVRKLNNKASQKALPEHSGSPQEIIEQLPVIPVKMVEETPAAPAEAHPHKSDIEEEIFKIDKEPSTFEFILNDKPSTDKFEFEEKSIDEIFDRPLSKEEAQIIAQKQKLRELDSLESELPEEDEIGPEPFLVSEPFKEEAETEELAEEEEYITPGEQTAIPGDNEKYTGEEVTAEYTAPQDTAAVAVQSDVKQEDQEVETLGEEDDFEDEEDFVGEANAEQDLIEETKEELKEEEPAAHIPEEPKARPTLNDILSGNTGTKSFTAGSTRMPVTDLKQAISLNDKMRYIKDLFNGYNLAYAEAIDLLNKMPDFKTADVFLQNNYAVKNNWAAKQETAEQFYELLNQRFPAK